MICAEIEDRLWDAPGDGDPPEDLIAHLASCRACLSLRTDIARIRQALRVPAPHADRLAPGIIARMSRSVASRAVGWRRAAAILLVGVTLGLAVRLPPRTEIRTVVVRAEVGPIHGVLSRFERDPRFEDTFIEVLNEALRRRSVPGAESMANGTSEVIR